MSHSHDHPHGDHTHHHHEVEPVEGSWLDPGDDRPSSVERRRFLAGLGIAAGAVGVAGAVGTGEAHAHAPVNPWGGGDRWYAGDHHIHTQYSDDGQYTIAQQVEKAHEFGLDWVVITDHGGPAHQKFSIDQVTPDIEKVRRAQRDVLVYQGLEWNIPGAEHATVFLPPGKHTVDILKAFEFAYDGRIASNAEPLALAALRYLEAQVLSGRTEIALMFANHPSRRGVDSPHELRGWRDAAPGVAVGMEGAPGHQAAGIPKSAGGPGRARGYYDTATPSAEAFPGYPPESYRTHGGFDWMTAKVGGVWDALLAEGRPWWITANSDVHQVFNDTFTQGKQDYATTGSKGAPIDSGVQQTGYGDFFPGQYGANIVGARSKSYVDIMRAMQAGKVLTVHGRLVDGLELRVRSRDDLRGVTLGGRTFVRRGGDVEVTIEVTRASGPNFAGLKPVLAKVDLISGPVTGPSIDRDAFLALETVVTRTFEVPRSGKIRFTHTFKNVERAFYLRLRGSDGKRLTPSGDPMIDELANSDPWQDLWFYANPVFVDVI
ncbi:PHP domain-containing protein [Lentzea sp. NBRC 102530]|uniref:PHP domain-containing protein n=1 Tax=Lentzea sp. NBRC 102530 TaxID=3032201 RepID=UPI0024A5DC0A|nr:PHP domain-containing protein [Lentzea sp. NBRC 102530]GLY46552.1 histidinol-phosphatase [Lentzea sp. NBRC 102530]